MTDRYRCDICQTIWQPDTAKTGLTRHPGGLTACTNQDQCDNRLLTLTTLDILIRQARERNQIHTIPFRRTPR